MFPDPLQARINGLTPSQFRKLLGHLSLEYDQFPENISRAERLLLFEEQCVAFLPDPISRVQIVFDDYFTKRAEVRLDSEKGNARLTDMQVFESQKPLAERFLGHEAEESNAENSWETRFEMVHRIAQSIENSLNGLLHIAEKHCGLSAPQPKP